MLNRRCSRLTFNGMLCKTCLFLCLLTFLGCDHIATKKYTIVIDESYFQDISFWQKRKLVKLVEHAIQDITQYFGTSYIDTLKVQIFESKLSDGRKNQIYLSVDDMQNNGLIVHEVTHAILPLNKNKFESEGLAVFMEMKYTNDSSKVRAKYREYMYKYDCEFHSLEFLMQHSSAFFLEDRCAMYAYHQAGSFYQYLEEVYGKTKLLKFCSQGVTEIDSIYSVSVDSLDTAWRKWLLD